MLAMSATDADLIPGLAARDEATAARFLELYWARAFRIARQITGDDAAAEDAAQEAFLAALRGVGRLGPGDDLRAWFFTIVARTAQKQERGRARRAARHERAASPQGPAAPAEEAARAEAAALVGAHLQRLSPKLRHALALRFLEGLSLEEVATALEIPRQTVSSRIRLGLEALREGLAPALGLSLAALPPVLAEAMRVPVPPAPRAGALLAALDAAPLAPAASGLLARARPRALLAVLVGVTALGVVAGALRLGSESASTSRAPRAEQAERPPRPARESTREPERASDVAALASQRSAPGEESRGPAPAGDPGALAAAPIDPSPAPPVPAARRLRGRTVDLQGRALAGARVALYELIPDPTRVPASSLDAAWLARAIAALEPPLTRAIEERAWSQGAVATERAATLSGSDGSFALDWPAGLAADAALLLQARTADAASEARELRADEPERDLGPVSLREPESFAVRVRCAGAPVPGALVTVGGFPARPLYAHTDGQGLADLRQRPRELQLQVSAPGCATHVGRIPADAQRAGELEVVLEPAGLVSGTVVDPAGRPVAGAAVAALPDHPDGLSVDEARSLVLQDVLVPASAALNAQRGLLEQTTTDAQGRFSLRAVPARAPFALVVRPDAPDLQWAVRRVLPGGGELLVALGSCAQALCVRLELQGTQVSAAARPGSFNDVPVRLERRQADGGFASLWWSRAVREGEVWFEGLPPGEYRVRVAAGAARSETLRELSAGCCSDPFQLSPGAEPRRVTVALDLGRTVRGRVIDRSGRPVAALVSWRAGDRSEGVDTAEDGTFELELFPREETPIVVQLEDGTELTITAPAGAVSLPDVVVDAPR